MRKNYTASFKAQVVLEWLKINRSTLYYQVVVKSDKEVRLKHRIDEIYTDYPAYGTWRITAVLRREGWDVNRKRVQCCMREMGIASICPEPNLSERNLQHKVYPYLLRSVTVIA